MSRAGRDAALVGAFLLVGALTPALVRATAGPPAAAPGRAADLPAAKRLDAAACERQRGIRLVREGRHAEGRAVLERLRPGRADAAACLHLARARARTEAVVEAVELLALLALEPRASAEVKAELARLLLDEAAGASRSPTEAVRWAEAALEDGARCYDLLARAYVATDELDAARAVIEACLADPDAHESVQAACLRVRAALPAGRGPG